MSNILVVGGAGFIGSHLTERFVNDGHSVTVLDNMFLGSPKNLEGIDCKIIRNGVLDLLWLDKLLKNIDYVFWEAGQSSAPHYEPNPSHAVRETLGGFLRVLELCQESNVERVIYASSASVYGSPFLPKSFREVVSYGYPLSFYAETKIAMERFAQIFNNFFDIDIIGLRYFSVYGPREKFKGKYANVAHQFLWSMMNGERPIIYSDGTQSRDYIYVDDVVEATVLAMENGTPGDVYNVGCGKSYTFNHIVKILNKLLKTKIVPRYIQNPISNYVYHTLADITKAENVLKFKARIPFVEGLRRLVEYEKS